MLNLLRYILTLFPNNDSCRYIDFLTIHSNIARKFILHLPILFLNKISDLTPPLLIGMAVDIVVKTENTLLINLGITNQTHQLIWLAVLTVVVWGTESVFEYLFQTKWRTIAQNLLIDLE